MANSMYFDYKYDTYQPQARTIFDEVHLVKLGEFRKFDYAIRSYSNVSANVELNVDYAKNGFYVAAAPDSAIDEYGFIRVTITYAADV